MRSAWWFLADLVPFDGSASRSSAVEVPPYLSSWFFGSAVLFRPSPAPAWRSSRILFNKEKVVIWSPAMVVQGCGVG